MKLRNKKTGEIVEAESCNSYLGTIGLFFEKGTETDRAYETLAELNAEWEDYKPAEPLIKDEKIRKAVRAWAEVNNLEWAAYSADGKFYDNTTDIEISFTTYTNRLDIPECRLLPIAELCGEEEE